MFHNLKNGMLLLAWSALLAGCAQPGSAPQETRAQDGRNDFAPTPATLNFAALADSATKTDRWAGVLGGAAYHVEVPANWNGRLVLFAHGYAGEGKALVVQDPQLRRRSRMMWKPSVRT